MYCSVSFDRYRFVLLYDTGRTKAAKRLCAYLCGEWVESEENAQSLTNGGPRKRGRGDAGVAAEPQNKKNKGIER
jgi:hypothetical protein